MIRAYADDMFFGRVVMGVAALAAAVFSAGASPAAPVLITITDARVAEGGPGRLLVFEVRANGGLEGSARVAFATREGSAFEGEHCRVAPSEEEVRGRPLTAPEPVARPT